MCLFAKHDMTIKKQLNSSNTEQNTLIPFDSSNYRPIPVSNSASKLIKKVIFSPHAEFLVTCDRQFGFKQNHSTDMCIFALKETVSY